MLVYGKNRFSHDVARIVISVKDKDRVRTGIHCDLLGVANIHVLA